MFKYLKKYRFYITLSLFLLIPLIAIDTATKAPRDHRFWDKVVVALTRPIQNGVAYLMDSAVYGYQNYIYLWNLRSDNSALYDENRKLFNTIIQLREAYSENERLRNLLKFTEGFSLTGVVARVIAKDVSTEFRSIRINRGESSGIRKDMAVINSEGVVGRILRTTEDTADVVTVLDLLSAVDAIVERTRARGIVEGMTDESCQLKYTLRTDDVVPGDILISSGLGGIFPKGVPVGVVHSIKKKSYGITQDIEVRPSVDFSKLEEVMVIVERTRAPVHVAEPHRSVTN